MIRSAISKFTILLIVLFSIISVFWFFKTSALKKSVLAAISESKGNASAASVSVAGFPFKQQLKINELKLQFSAVDNLPEQTLSNLPSNIIPNNKYQIQIRNFESTSGIFSSDFTVSALEDVSVINQDGTLNSVQFNQNPVITFSVPSGMLSAFSYQDSGYKILDAGKNVLFENGSSVVSFTSTEEGNGYRGKITAQLKDVGALSFSNEMPVPEVAKTPEIATNNSLVTADPNANPVTITENTITPEVAPVAEAPKEVIQENSVVNTDLSVANTDIANSLVKKSFMLDLEFVSSKSPTPSPMDSTVEVPQNPVGEPVIELIDIKNFEISSPLYKINVYGQINPLAKEGTSMINVSVKIEKLDNVLIHIKRSIVNISVSKDANKIEEITDPENTIHESVVSNQVVANPTENTTPVITAVTQKPEADILEIIKNLSKKNAATNDEVAMFEFRQEKNKDLLINETPIVEIIAQIFNPETKALEVQTPNSSPAIDSPAATLQTQPTPQTQLTPAKPQTPNGSTTTTAPKTPTALPAVAPANTNNVQTKPSIKPVTVPTAPAVPNLPSALPVTTKIAPTAASPVENKATQAPTATTTTTQPSPTTNQNPTTTKPANVN